MPRTNYILASLLVLCLCANMLPVAAQTKPANPSKNLTADFSLAADALEAFARMKKGDGIFAAQLTKMIGGDRDTADALDAQGIYFYERVHSQIKDQFAQTVEKAREANKKRYEEMKAKPGAVKNGPVKPIPARNAPVKQVPARGKATIRYDAIPGNGNTPVFRNAAYSPTPDDIQVTQTETETGAGATAKETKTMETGSATVTRTAEVTRNVNFDEKRIAVESINHEKTEAVSKADRGKLTSIANVAWKVAFDTCPDAEGKVRGTGQAHFYFQTTINTGRELAALTSDTLVDIYITAHVNDAAEMTHFDMTGKATEETTGYDRALDRGIVDTTNGIEDGKTNIIFAIDNSAPPRTAEPDQYGVKKNISPVLGESTTQTNEGTSIESANRVIESSGRALAGMMIDLELLMRTSISRWQNYECVDVECIAPKKSLKPSESVEVTAASVSKMGGGKFNAPSMRGVGTQSVTPEEQAGTPSAVYTLTAPKNGKAEIVVTSTSKRGIGIGSLELAVVKPKKPPIEIPLPPKRVPDPLWTGTIKAVHTEKKERDEPLSGRYTMKKVTTDKRWEVTVSVLGTRDTTGGIVNNFHANAEVAYTGDERRESRLRDSMMGCGNQGIIKTNETKVFEIKDKGAGRSPILVTITVIGSNGYFGFGSPDVQAERRIIQKYDSSCATYNAVNSFDQVDPRGISIGAPSFELNFQIDPEHPDELTGTKNVVEVDGSETQYSWNLRRVK